MSTVLFGNTYSYDGISDTNYDDEGKFHNVQRPDSSLLVGATKANYTSTAVIDVQICFGDTSDEVNWFYLLENVDATSDASGNGKLLVAPPNGVTGVRIVPEPDADTTFTLTVREFFNPDKISAPTPGQYLVS